MNRDILDINDKKSEIIALLEKAKHIVLATCADERVTARTMGYVNIGLDVFFGTDQRFLKVEQILNNPKVALCLASLQIEGTAEIRGHPSKVENAEFCEHFKRKHPRSYEIYMATKNQVVIKVSPVLLTQWKYIDGKPCWEFYDLTKSMAFREWYEVV